MTPRADVLEQATTLLAEAARVDRATLSDDDLVSLLGLEQQAARFLGAGQVLTAGEIAERSRHELGAAGLSMRFGERKPVNFIEQITRVSQAEATRRVRVGSQVRPRVSLLGELLPSEHPIAAEALLAGAVGVDAVDVILSGLKHAAAGTAATPEARGVAETELVALAGAASTDLVADAARLWRDALDPDGIEPRYEQIRARRMVIVGREHGGITRYTINAAPTLAALLAAALQDSMDPKAPPRFLSEEELAEATRETIDTGKGSFERIVDPRTLAQKQHDILEGVLTAALRATRDAEPSLRSIGSVTAVIQLKDLSSGTGFGIIEGVDEAIPASVIEELACENGFTTVLLGNGGEPLAHGLLARYFTGAQRRAMIARDGDRCVAAGCRRPAAVCHAHHVVFYSDDGPTDIDNGVLLCPAHHHALHQGAFQLKMIDGLPWIRQRPGFQDDNAWKSARRNRLLSTVLSA